MDVMQQETTKILDHLASELAKIRTGRASSELVDELPVEVYGQQMPLNQVATVSVPEPRTIAIQPWDKSSVKPIEKAIQEADLGMNPNNTGDRILLNLPPLTEETRLQLSKQAKQKGEEARIALRNVREHAIKKTKDGETSEDEQRQQKESIQKTIDSVNEKIDEMLKNKENDIMTI